MCVSDRTRTVIPSRLTRTQATNPHDSTTMDTSPQHADSDGSRSPEHTCTSHDDASTRDDKPAVPTSSPLTAEKHGA